MVRTLMNELMGITRDKDVINIPRAPSKIVMNYEVDDSQGPNLKPMTPHFAKRAMEYQWNQRLCEMFIVHFQKQNKLRLTQEEAYDVEIMFEQRLDRLYREFKWRSYRDDETVAGYRERISSKHKRVLESQRPNSRRVQVRGDVLGK